MKFTLKTLAACGAIALSVSAAAQSRHHNEHRHHNQVNVVNNTNAGDVVGALIIGGVIGAVIANNQRSQEVVVVQTQEVVVVQPQPVCYNQPLYDQYGRLAMYRRVCQ